MARKRLVISDLRGGRNGSDVPLSLPDNQCTEALNVDFYEGTLGRKRNGAAAYTQSFSAGTTPTGLISSMFCGAGEADARYYAFIVDNAATPIVNHTTASAQWDQVNGGDAISGNAHAIHAVPFNDKIFVCYDSSVDRLHYFSYSASLSANSFYRVGLPAPTAAPTVANTGAGTYAAVARYYKVAWLHSIGGSVFAKSELSAASTVFTPSGGGTAARVTQPSVPADEEITSWEVYGSADGVNYKLLSNVAIATTTYDDSATPSLYAGDAPATAGSNTVPKSWKYIATDGNRLIGAGCWEASNNQSRVWFTPVMGASDIGDDARVPTSNFVDVGAYDGDSITGLVGSFMGNVVVFKGRAIYRLVPTGDADAPYKTVCLTKHIGCIAPKSIVQGEDENGNPSIYFMSHRGPYRLGSYGLEYCGRDVEDVTSTMYQSATVICHAVWHPNRHQVWFWVATGTSTYPDTRLVFDVHLGRRGTGGVRGGWAKHTGASCTAVCSMMYGPTLRYGNYINVTNPYVGSSVTNNLILRCDEASVWADNGAAYQSYVKTKPYALGGLGVNCSVGQSHLSAKATTGATITQTIDRDYGTETRTSSCSLTALAGETRVQRQLEGSEVAGAGVVQFQIGDASATTTSWTLDALMVPYAPQEER